jgi:hypothetical protein
VGFCFLCYWYAQNPIKPCRSAEDSAGSSCQDHRLCITTL